MHVLLEYSIRAFSFFVFVTDETVTKMKTHVPIVFVKCLQCFDAVGWAAGRASGL